MVFAKWLRLEATFNIIHLKFNDSASGEHKYWEAVQKTMLDMHECIQQADAWIQLMHVAIRHVFEASEEETISVVLGMANRSGSSWSA
jgi:truncated hemoglobin YjbI